MSKSGIDTRSGLRKRSNSRFERDRVEVGDGQRPGDHRARARAAARPDRNVVGLGPLDEVGDDQEVAGEPHADDDVELEIEAVAIDLPCLPRCGLRGAARGPHAHRAAAARPRRRPGAAGSGGGWARRPRSAGR